MHELTLSSVTKRFGGAVAVDGASFQVQPGRLYGLLGPNGAGKTTALRMIAAILKPDSGSIHYGGEPAGPATQRVMGYLPEERGLYKKMKVGEQLLYLAQLKGLPAHVAQQEIRVWLERFEATDWVGKKVSELSKGMQQKVQFIATLLHRPGLVILDEPFSGLDPLNAELLEDVVRELREDGRTVLFASHRMEQVEQLCDDICLIADGRVLLEGSLRKVKQRFSSDTITMEFDGADHWIDDLTASDNLDILTRTDGRLEARLPPDLPAQGILEAALPHAHIRRFVLHEPPLTEIFREAVSSASAHD